MPGAEPPTPPRAARLPERLATALDVTELDHAYADVDGVDLEGATLSLPDARTLDLLRSRLRSCEIEVPDGCVVELRDCHLEGVDLSGRRIGSVVRTRLDGCRLTGVDASEATFEDVELEDCALDLASWRIATIERVAIRGGRLDGLDATRARLTDVSVAGVALDGVALDGVRCVRVDLTEADLTPVARVADLAGATIGAAQAIALSARLASGLGIAVRVDESAFPP